ncbi:MAG: hypothetical protein LJE85_00015 [Gammaproteobacteria bacterium]|nr:hypothetical protein [Gammaproteobacteria bacterium]
MPTLPEYEQQVRQTHAELIHAVVNACVNIDRRAELEPVLQAARSNGWEALSMTIEQILGGRRDDALLNGLDKEDAIITKAILEGLQNPATLPERNKQADPTMAAPGLAHMIHAASRGDPQALQGVSLMAEQMTQATGDLRLLGGLMHRLINGERNPDALCKGMGPSGEQLLLSLLEELNKLNMQ